MNYNYFPKETIKQINKSTGRVYETPTGGVYPSVTTITGLLSRDAIAAWRARVGEAEANRISSIASANGTRWHSLCESFLKEPEKMHPTLDQFASASSLWISEIFPHIDNIRGIEYSSWSDKLRCAGTIDLIADWDNELSIIDWKTTRHKKQPNDIVGYWCQTASYAYMVKERFNLVPKNLVIVFNESNQDVYFYKQPVRPWLEEFIKVRKEYMRMYHI